MAGQPGRPSIFTEELASRICERLALGETLRGICRDDDMPAESTVRRWASNDEHPISAQYKTAREIGYQCMADEIIDISDRSDDPRLQVDSRKWLLSKALPKIYGDRQTHEVELSANAQLLALIEGRMNKARGAA